MDEKHDLESGMHSTITSEATEEIPPVILDIASFLAFLGVTLLHITGATVLILWSSGWLRILFAFYIPAAILDLWFMFIQILSTNRLWHIFSGLQPTPEPGMERIAFFCLCGSTLYLDMARESGTPSVTSEPRPVDGKARVSCGCGGALRVHRFRNVEGQRERALVE